MGTIARTISNQIGSDGKLNAAGLDLADNFAFTGTVSGAGGITQADLWRVTTDFTGAATPIANNWERADDPDAGLIGSGVSQSSGVFSFPETGIYLIRFAIASFLNGESRHDQAQIYISTDSGSSFNQYAEGDGFSANLSNNTHYTVSTDCLVDVSNISTFRCRFHITRNNSSVGTDGNTDSNKTFAYFIRLGDT